MKKGDIVLIPFPFTNLYKGKMDVVVSFITSKIQWEGEYDLLISPSDKNGLKKKIFNKNRQNRHIGFRFNYW